MEVDAFVAEGLEAGFAGVLFLYEEIVRTNGFAMGVPGILQGLVEDFELFGFVFVLGGFEAFDGGFVRCVGFVLCGDRFPLFGCFVQFRCVWIVGCFGL